MVIINFSLIKLFCKTILINTNNISKVEEPVAKVGRFTARSATTTVASSSSNTKTESIVTIQPSTKTN